jgi:hypothetical protein
VKKPILSALCVLALTASCAPAGAGLEFSVAFDSAVLDEAVDGRVLVIIAPSDASEPRFQAGSAGPDAAQIFGVDVEGVSPGEPVVIGGDVFGFPVESLADLPAGEYSVQAVLHRYETYNLATGHTVKLPPMDRNDGQQWSRQPGNLISTPQTMRVDPASGATLELALDQVIPPIAAPEDTEYVKHITMQSDLLTDFWGRPVSLGAHVLLPEGFDEHPEARYPIAIFHGHFPADFGGFRPEPPDPDLEPDYSARFDLEGYNIIQQAEAHEFYKAWTGPDFPRMIIVEIQHPTPYYDDSYAVNSASQGPWGDAITHELIPHIEEQFRGIGEGWARFLYGGSTGGWEALAVQVFYPDEYNGTFAACPDPIDFRAYELVNIYEHDNAYVDQGTFHGTERPGRRDWLGRVSTTVRASNLHELALGTKGRSGQQWDIWQATYSPQGADGYPQPIFDKVTGEIDPEVAEYWRENYDLVHIMQRDWATLGPKLEGKIHIYVGDMDNYYLNNAVYLAEEFLESTTEPYYNGIVDYGDRAEHCWNGDHENSNAISRLRYNSQYIPRILERIAAAAPPGADLTSWRY